MGKRVATIDVGTNSVRLLVAEIDQSSREFKPVFRGLQIARLGEGLQQDRRLKAAAIERTVNAVKANLARARELGSTVVAVVGTSALRDAANADQFAARLAALGVELEIISGVEEARLSFVGAVRALMETGALTADGGQVAVMDIGGGSTEIVAGRVEVEAGISMQRLFSVDAGGVRMTERHLSSIIQGPVDLFSSAWLKMRADIAEQIDRLLAEARLDPGYMLVGVGGTATTLAAMAQGLTEYRPEKVQGYRIGLEEVEALLGKLAALPLDERRKVPGLQPERADIILAGIEIARQVMTAGGFAGLVVSDSDLLQGLIYDRSF